jgi:PIN domain nuclease of toxin-antitoxin system
MVPRFVLDTHALVWYLEGNPRLGHRAKRIIDEATSELVLPLIALSEAAFIVERGRTSISDVASLVVSVEADPRLEIYPLTIDVLRHSLTLTAIPEMHDRLIVATVLHLQQQGDSISLLTKDVSIAATNTVPVVW